MFSDIVRLEEGQQDLIDVAEANDRVLCSEVPGLERRYLLLSWQDVGLLKACRYALTCAIHHGSLSYLEKSSVKHWSYGVPV